MIKKLSQTVLSLKTRFVYVIDELKFQLKSITALFDRIEKTRVSTITPIRSIDVPSSVVYNRFLSAVEDDVTLIRGVQTSINDSLVAGWNVSESVYKKIEDTGSMYDNEFLIEHELASVIDNSITVAVKSFTSKTSFIKDSPILRGECSNKDVPVYYGKAYGAYIKGDESGEDGIRYENNDGSLIIDESDTFWECESVVLQESRENTKFLQGIIPSDISLNVTCKIVFKEPISINTFSVIPYNAAVSAYYRLLKCEVSDGVEVIPLDIKETLVISETQFLFEIPEELKDRKIRSMFITFKQNGGYFMKYSLAYFKLQSTTTWIDATGPHLISLARKLGDNFDENVTSVIHDMPNWILNYWLPGTAYTDQPILDTTQGTDGFYLVPSVESERKRYTVGITDLKIGTNDYASASEIVTKEIELNEGTNRISIDVTYRGEIFPFISFDNGMTWNKIIPLGTVPVYDIDLRLIPDTLYINSDISTKRKKNTDTGERAFIDTASEKVRVRFVLKYDEESNTMPIIYSWNLKQEV